MTRVDPEAAAIKQRMDIVFARYSQSEVARRTGTSRQNVSRYASGGKIPLQFANALTRELGVNPAWLVAGEGTPWLTDIRTEAAETTTDMLDIVKAMNAVARRRMGELVGKRGQQDLRELKEALVAHDMHRKRIVARIKPMLVDITRGIPEAIAKGDLERARRLEALGVQIGLFAPDPNLETSFDSARGHLAQAEGRHAEALQLERQAFLQLSYLGTDSVNFTHAALNYIVSLITNHRLREARRVCGSVLSLTSDGAVATDNHYRFFALMGDIETSLGDLRGGIVKLYAARASCAPDFQIVRTRLLRAELLAGVVEPQAAIAQAEYPRAESIVLQHLCWLEDADLLQAALRRSQSIPPESRKEASALVYGRAVAMHEALRRSGRVPEATSAQNDAHAVALLISQVQQLRVRGRGARAVGACTESHTRLLGLDRELTLDVYDLATHCRNLMGLKVPTAARQYACSWLETAVQNGYRCFEPLLRSAGQTNVREVPGALAMDRAAIVKTSS